ncbi:hypothetical protein ACK3ZL_20520, partial [Aeromonas caviae]
TSRSFWRYWVSAIGKFIPKSGAECRLDALHCQRETLEKISEKKAHVVVQCILAVQLIIID